MRKFVIGGLILAFTIAMAGVASGKSTFTQHGHDQGIDLAMAKGGKQLSARSGPLAVQGENYRNPRTMPEKAGRVRLLFDEGIKLNSGKFPACSRQDRANMEGTSSDDARRLCPKAQLSLNDPALSQATAAINFGTDANPSIIVVHPVVTAFNGPPKNGNPTIILHAFLSSPVANTTVLDGELKKVGKKTLLDVNKIPPLAGGLGALTDFFATLNKRTKDRAAIRKAKKRLKRALASGNKRAIRKARKALRRAKKKRINFINAKCTGGSYETQGTWNLGQYDDPSNLNSFRTKFTITGTDSVPCKGNGDTVVPFSSGR